MRLPVIEREAYTVSLQGYEDHDGSILCFIHCDIHIPWSKNVKADLRKDFDSLCSLNKQRLFTISDLDDTKHHKFLAMFGFHLLKTIGLADGSNKHIYMKSPEN